MNKQITNKQMLGRLGEKIALDYLVDQKYLILQTNFLCSHGEIDIIAMDISGDAQVVFVEVKTRTNVNFGEPQEAVDMIKQMKIIKTALYFLNASTTKIYNDWRTDVIAIKLDKNNQLMDLTHFKNIFDG